MGSVGFIVRGAGCLGDGLIFGRGAAPEPPPTPIGSTVVLPPPEWRARGLDD